MAINTPTPGATTGEHLRGLFPDQTFMAADVMPDALLFELTTVAGNVEGDAPAVRVPYVKADPTVGFVAEGALIPEADPTLDELVIRTDKIAVLTRTSNEATRNTPGSSSILSRSLTRAVTVKGNAALLGSVADPIGLANVTGATNGGELGTNLDALEDVIGQIEAAGGTPTHVVAHPLLWSKVRAMKAGADSNVPLLGSPAEQTERRVFGLDVIVSPSAPEDRLLVTSKQSIYSAAGPLMLATSGDLFFDRDSTAIRATWRIGWDVIDPAHIGTVTVTAPAA
ncbi:phage major capsid protein [Micrococcaceae bacterium Sec6.3]